MKYERIVICGGGFSGSLAAIVCSRYARRVTVLERYPDAESSQYAGTPQSHHVHIMLKRGQDLLEQLLPGSLAALEAKGARQADWAGDTAWEGSSGTAPLYESGLRSLLFSRKLLEGVLKVRIEELGNIEIVAAFVKKIECVEGRVRSIALSQGNTIDSFDLCIDARGRSSLLKENLEPHIGKIPEDFIKNTLRYATTVVEHKFAQDEILQYYRQANSREDPLGYYASYVEGNRAIFTAVDYNGTIAKPFEALKSHPLLQGKEIAETWVFSKLHNHRYQFGKTKRWIKNLLVIGDAACRLNPVYGQGLTVCLEQIALLDRSLQSRAGIKAHKFQKNVDKIVAGPWSMVKIDEMRSTAASSNVYYRGIHALLDFVGNAALRDEKLNRISLGLLHRVQSPMVYLNPANLFRIILANFQHSKYLRDPLKRGCMPSEI